MSIIIYVIVQLISTSVFLTCFQFICPTPINCHAALLNIFFPIYFLFHTFFFIYCVGVDSEDITTSTGDRTDSTYTEFNDEDFLEARTDLLGVINLCSFVDKNENNSDTENIPHNNIIQSNNLINEANEDIDTDTDKVKKSIITETKKIKNITVSTDDVGKSFNITLEQFEGVPVSIRGRCKLMDIQQVLTRLQTYYTTYINSHNNSKRITVASLSVLQPLSLPELSLSGLKVTGKTGDCVLGTLRSLGYIKIGKTGKTGILLSDLMVAKLLR